MMKWIDRWFFRKWQWAWENRDQPDLVAVQSSTAINKLAGRGIIEEDLSPWNDGLRIGIKKMIGGYVVSFRIYDRVRDRSDDRAYIITDEQDFNTELGKIITMESMRQS
jgi:hypothetical protein